MYKNLRKDMLYQKIDALKKYNLCVITDIIIDSLVILEQKKAHYSNNGKVISPETHEKILEEAMKMVEIFDENVLQNTFEKLRQVIANQENNYSNSI
jgi:hypothetical protein